MVFITNQSVQTEIKRQQKLAYDIADYQQQISTGAKFDKPSDNPQDWIQISYVGRQQSLNQAWKDNLSFAQSRAAQAASSLDDVSTLLTDVQARIISASSQEAGSPGSEAIALTLEGVRETIKTILNQTNYQGTPDFDDTVSNLIPIGQGLAYEATGTRQSIENVTAVMDTSTTPATPKTIYQILDDAIAAVRGGSSNGAAISASIKETKAALDHVIVAGSQQGVRSKRLDDEVARLQNQKLNLTERRSNLEDTDLTEAVTKVQSKLVTLQAAQAVFSKVNQQTLFDYLK